MSYRCLQGLKRTSVLVATLFFISACGSGGGGGGAPAQTPTPTTPSASIADNSITEGDGGSSNLSFTVTLSAAASGTVTIAYATTDGTATTADGDYTATSGTLTIPAGQTSGTISVPVLGDTAYEADETFTVTLSNPSGATLGTSSATGTITNDDSLTISIADASVAEGDGGSKNLSFTVTLSAADHGTVTVEYATADGTATTADGDYTATSGAIMILSAGPTSVTINVPVLGDTAYEADETFTVTLSNPSGATLGTSSATGTISNDDSLAISISDASVAEGNSGPAILTFIVALNGKAASDVTVDYATADGTGNNRATTADSDYIAKATTQLTISAGSTSKTFDVTVQGDTIPESNETFKVNLSNPSGSGAILGTSTATGTISNDDAFGKLNDTGMDTWGNASVNNLTATQTLFPGQDADYGRDSTNNVDTDGHNGFSFTQLDSNGDTMATSGDYINNPWSCVRDNVTGLIWEVKTDTGGNDLNDQSWTYTWYNSDSASNGGGVGSTNGGSCIDATNCDTEKYVAAVNGVALCGFTDWRLPTRDELALLIDHSNSAYNGGTGATVDLAYFPNVIAGGYWTASSEPASASTSTKAWSVYFSQGNVVDGTKFGTLQVRLVRGGS